LGELSSSKKKKKAPFIFFKKASKEEIAVVSERAINFNVVKFQGENL